MCTDYYLNVVAGNAFGTQTSPGLPTSYWLGLSQTQPTTSGSGVTEPVASAAYDRVLLTSLTATGTAGEVTNSNLVAFQESTGNWGTLDYYVVYDAQTGGNLLMFDNLQQSRVVGSGTTVGIKAGELTLSVVSV